MSSSSLNAEFGTVWFQHPGFSLVGEVVRHNKENMVAVLTGLVPLPPS
jgi:hypothetical protein